MGTEKEQGAPAAFINRHDVPEIYASEVSGLFLTGGNVAITLESLRINHATSPGPAERVVVGRVVLTGRGAQNLVVLLNTFLEQQGLSPSEAFKGGQQSQ